MKLSVTFFPAEETVALLNPKRQKLEHPEKKADLSGDLFDSQNDSESVQVPPVVHNPVPTMEQQRKAALDRLEEFAKTQIAVQQNMAQVLAGTKKSTTPVATTTKVKGSTTVPSASPVPSKVIPTQPPRGALSATKFSAPKQNTAFKLSTSVW